MAASGLYAVQRSIRDLPGSEDVVGILLRDNLFFLSVIALWAVWAWEFWTKKEKLTDGSGESQSEATSN